ncbi:sterol desaturase family protein [Marinoscillum sp. MHG1-6]|uniref:sterol desaturase family protein n=1 Tax=Marinoscillum sp. MHG1-6 TaxID=2959627 RepID=UPI00280A5E42|nr:sterol desaturase family protein [Marinoscillum sp. MHG1-6]
MMNSLVDFFSDTPLWFRLTMLLGGIAFFWIIEMIIPLFTIPYRKIRHAGLNLFFNGTTALINLGLASLLVGSSVFVTNHEIGVLYLFEAPLWVKTILCVLLMDLIGAWFIHWLEHQIKWMWLFHLIHHTDTHVDVTTGLRHHPGESIFRMSFTILGVIITGAPIWMLMIYQSLSALFTHFNHANISLPDKLDRLLSWVFVTPNMHKVHHHYTQPLTDTNYGNMFSIWDRVFGTFAQVEDSRDLIYGIDTHTKPSENDNLGNLLAIPFQKYRPPTGKFVKEEKKEN